MTDLSLEEGKTTLGWEGQEWFLGRGYIAFHLFMGR